VAIEMNGLHWLIRSMLGKRINSNAHLSVREVYDASRAVISWVYISRLIYISRGQGDSIRLLFVFYGNSVYTLSSTLQRKGPCKHSQKVLT
jgi:hypothetical protein